MKKYSLELTVALAGLLLPALLGTYLPPGSMGDKVEFRIVQGDGSAKVARLLAEQGLVRSRYLFIGYTILTGKEKDFKAGRYLLSKSMNIPEVVRIFSEGKAEPEGILVTIPEGLNSGEIVGLLRKNFEGLKISGFQKNEGYLFPDTYYLENQKSKIEDQNKGAEEIIIKKLKDNFAEKTEGLKVTLQTTIIASILEKEVRTEEDMRLVAGIIYKRLKLGMPLQIDAAVAYGICLPKWLNGKACDVAQANLVEGIKADSSYNTYIRKGLPPTPVSNPGLKAINAALNPVASDYLYYLSTKDDGRTIFSKTAEEHTRNRTKYLLKN